MMWAQLTYSRRNRMSRRVGNLIPVLMVLGVLVADAPSAHAQDGFKLGYTDVGPVIGLGGIGSATVSIGGRLEFGVADLPDLGKGVLGVEVSIDHYSYNAFNYGFSYTPLGATANYHFHLENAKFDPFVGLGLGDLIFSAPSSCPTGCSYNASGIYFIGRLGMRYFVSPKLALYGDVGSGSGAGALHVGVTFKLKDGK
jgi:hypothetical protein